MKAHPDTIRVYVTWRDIERGLPHDSAKCPIAWALTRRAGRASVDKETAVIGYAHDSTSYRLPPAARRFVKTFDNGHRVAPTSFVLRRVVDL
jgi:hypothetical protein